MRVCEHSHVHILHCAYTRVCPCLRVRILCCSITSVRGVNGSHSQETELLHHHEGRPVLPSGVAPPCCTPLLWRILR